MTKIKSNLNIINLFFELILKNPQFYFLGAIAITPIIFWLFKINWNLLLGVLVGLIAFFYTFFTIEILRENQKLRVEQIEVKKKEIISLLFAYFNKYGIEEAILKKDTIAIPREDWELLKSKILSNTYLFNSQVSILLIKIFVEDKIMFSKSYKHYTINKDNLKYKELMKYISEEYK